MKHKLLLFLGLLCGSIYAQNSMEQTLHQFTVEALEGEAFDFSTSKGKK